MYIIITLQPEDRVVMVAVNAIVAGAGAIPGPDGNYVLVAPGAISSHGDGGAHAHTLVIVGHGNANSISGYRSWRDYVAALPQGVDLRGTTSVYVASCSANAADGQAFVHGNIAGEIAAAFPGAAVWASTSSVTAGTQAGDWERLQVPVA